MSDRAHEAYDVVAPKSFEKNGETVTAWTRVGSAWKTAKGDIKVVFNALPINGELMLMRKKDENEQKFNNK